MFSASRDYFTGRMFRRQFVPSLISALGLAVGDMADAIVVGQRMGVVGLAAISLTLPVFMVINVIMHGFGLGASIRYSTQLARGEHVEALSGFQGIMLLVPALGVLLALAANLMLTPLLALLGTVPGDGALFETSREYLRIVVSGTPVYFASYLMNYFLRNADREKLASFGFTFGNLCDIALNILFVLVLDMGAAGAALSTVLGQMIAVCIYALGLAARGSELGFKPFNPSFRGAFGCFRVGFASSSQYLYSMVFILLANNLLIDMYGSTGVAVFDLVQNASCLILYIYEGTARAAQPLLSTFSGEHNDQGRARTLRLALVWGTLAGGAAILFVALLPNVVCTVFGIDGADVASFVSSDNYGIGQLAAEYIGEQLGGSGQIAILTWPSASATADRAQGFLDKLAESYPDIEIVAEQDCNADRSTALNAAESIIGAHPEVQFIWGANAEMALGAYAATQSTNRTDIKVVAVDTDGEVMDAIAGGTNLVATVSQDPYTMGYKAVENAVKYLKGEAVEDVYIECEIVTADNCADIIARDEAYLNK